MMYTVIHIDTSSNDHKQEKIKANSFVDAYINYLKKYPSYYDLDDIDDTKNHFLKNAKKLKNKNAVKYTNEGESFVIIQPTGKQNESTKKLNEITNINTLVTDLLDSSLEDQSLFFQKIAKQFDFKAKHMDDMYYSKLAEYMQKAVGLIDKIYRIS